MRMRTEDGPGVGRGPSSVRVRVLGEVMRQAWLGAVIVSWCSRDTERGYEMEVRESEERGTERTYTSFLCATERAYTIAQPILDAFECFALLLGRDMQITVPEKT